ncbi:MAG: FecR domain-containing protein [Alteromonadaceae bacterium]|nr:FecR domain-containing protein [Alteromonadaceae bacterium]
MTKVIPFPNRSQNSESLKEQASLWVTRMDRGLSAQEQQQLIAWINQHISHQEKLFEMASLWDDFNVLNELNGLFPLEIKPKNQTKSFVKIAMAASITIMSIFGGGLFLSLDPFVLLNSATPSLSQINTFETQVGEQSSFTLSDGTNIQLNTNSLIEISYTSGKRQLTLLRGEARFDVAKDKTRPFTVISGVQSFTALGTIFNIQKNSENNMELVVTEGRVLITKTSEIIDKISTEIATLTAEKLPGIIVTSGEKAVIKQSIPAPIQTVSPDQIQRDLAWQKGMLIFEGEYLADALMEVSRYTNARFEIMNPLLAKIKVAGYFKAGDIDGLLQSLNSNFDISYQKVTANHIQLNLTTL